jgi:hypothetical protein
MKITQKRLEKAEAVYKEIVTKAIQNSDFKHELLSNPKKTLESFSSIKKDLMNNIVIDDQSDPSIIYFNIPQKIDFDNIELNDEQLEMVSGGFPIILGCILWTVGGYAVCAIVDHFN